MRSNVVIVGRSNDVGRPAASLAFARNTTVVSRDEHAYNAGRLAEVTSRADGLIVAAVVPVPTEKEHVREGVIAIGIGTNPVRGSRTGKQGFVGDLDSSGVATGAEALSPDDWLLKNTADAARIFTRAEAARRSLETATTDGIVEADTTFASSARGERIIR